MEHSEILHRCFRCGYCKLPENYVDLNCPAYLQYRFETYSPGGRMWLLRAWLDGKIEASSRFQEIMYSCTSCGNCVTHCTFPKFKDQLLLAMTAGRGRLVQAGKVPPKVRDCLTSLQFHGNPLRVPAKRRGDWTEDMDIEPYDGQDYLLFVGDAASCTPRGGEVARSIADLLLLSGVSFGILGKMERSDGNDALAMGEADLFRMLAEDNIRCFGEKGVKKIITVSPHSFHALKNEYPLLGSDFQVFHYTQLLSFLTKKWNFAKPAGGLRVVFHDPCYLGRHNLDYFSPRQILKALPGLELVEMDRSMGNALCCGGGGGNLYTDILGGGEDAAARVRVREAAGTGAKILAVACPGCAVMLADAVNMEQPAPKIRVMEISEIVREMLNG